MDKKPAIDWSQTLAIFVSVAALGLSGYQFYVSSIQEIHSFSWVFFGNGVYAVNSGNRTEVVTEAGYSYSDGASHFLNGEAAPSAIVKAGDVRYIALPSVDPAKINGAFPNGYSTIVDVTILDTRQGDRRGLALLRGGAVVAQTTIQSGQPIQVKSSPRVYHDFYGKSASGVLAP